MTDQNVVGERFVAKSDVQYQQGLTQFRIPKGQQIIIERRNENKVLIRTEGAYFWAQERILDDFEVKS